MSIRQKFGEAVDAARLYSYLAVAIFLVIGALPAIDALIKLHSPIADMAGLAYSNYTYLEELKDARDTLQRVIDSMEESR